MDRNYDSFVNFNLFKSIKETPVKIKIRNKTCLN